MDNEHRQGTISINELPRIVEGDMIYHAVLRDADNIEFYAPDGKRLSAMTMGHPTDPEIKAGTDETRAKIAALNVPISQARVIA